MDEYVLLEKWANFLRECQISPPSPIDYTNLEEWCPEGKQSYRSKKEDRKKYKKILLDLKNGNIEKYEESGYSELKSFKKLIKFVKSNNSKIMGLGI